MIHDVEISGKTYPLAFGMSLLLQYERETGKPVIGVFQSFQQGMAVEEMLRLVALAMTNGQRKRNLSAPTGVTYTNHVYTIDEVADLLDDAPFDKLANIVGLFSESMPPADGETAGEGDEEKKRAAGSADAL